MLIDPVINLKHNNNYVGLRIRFIYDKYGLTFHHAPEKTPGRYNVKVINIPYDIASINLDISKQYSYEIDKKTS